MQLSDVRWWLLVHEKPKPSASINLIVKILATSHADWATPGPCWTSWCCIAWSVDKIYYPWLIRAGTQAVQHQSGMTNESYQLPKYSKQIIWLRQVFRMACGRKPNVSFTVRPSMLLCTCWSTAWWTENATIHRQKLWPDPWKDSPEQAYDFYKLSGSLREVDLAGSLCLLLASMNFVTWLCLLVVMKLE